MAINNTKLNNFIATAYGMPSEIMTEIFEYTDSIEERNKIIFAECFVVFLKAYKDITIDDEKDSDEYITELFDTYYTEFLAEAVLATFDEGNVE